MRAVVMAGGEGTRLRPMTANQPKPLLPVVNRPIMEHVLRLLKRHGFDETFVTVQYLAAHIRAYFGDGDELGMSLSYATERTPLGTAGSVRNAGEALRDEPFLVISGDALTDFDLSAMVAFHRRRGALVTVALKRVPNPLEFGIVITEEDGRILRFLEKPTWGQVFSDTVNTGIYVMEPEVLDAVEPGAVVDWSADVFPKLLADGAPLYGWIADGYWEDVGHGRVLPAGPGRRAQPGRERRHRRLRAVLRRLGRRGRRGGSGSGAHRAAAHRQLRQGRGGAVLREYTVIGSNVVVKGGAVLERSVVHDNAYIGPAGRRCGPASSASAPTSCAAVQVAEGVIVGDDCVVEEEAVLGDGVAVYPSKVIEAGPSRTRASSGNRAASARFSGRAGSAGWSTSRSPPSCACGSRRPTRPRCARAAWSPSLVTPPGPRGPSSGR